MAEISLDRSGGYADDASAFATQAATPSSGMACVGCDGSGEFFGDVCPICVYCNEFDGEESQRQEALAIQKHCGGLGSTAEVLDLASKCFEWEVARKSVASIKPHQWNSLANLSEPPESLRFILNLVLQLMPEATSWSTWHDVLHDACAVDKIVAAEASHFRYEGCAMVRQMCLPDPNLCGFAPHAPLKWEKHVVAPLNHWVKVAATLGPSLTAARPELEGDPPLNAASSQRVTFGNCAELHKQLSQTGRLPGNYDSFSCVTESTISRDDELFSAQLAEALQKTSSASSATGAKAIDAETGRLLEKTGRLLARNSGEAVGRNILPRQTQLHPLRKEDWHDIAKRRSAAWQDRERAEIWPTEARQFVAAMQGEGYHNWVYHEGRAINLEDEQDTDSVDADTLQGLIDSASRDSKIFSKPLRFSCLPIQPWEAEKLQSLACQVISALRDGRYVKDFGELLFGQLHSWGSNDEAEDWARGEVAWARSLVDADDKESREQLLEWIEESLITTLREVQKAVNRSRLEGMMDAEGSKSRERSASEINRGGGSSSASHAQRPVDHDLGTRSDAAEELALQQALSESLEQGDLASDDDMVGVGIVDDVCGDSDVESVDTEFGEFVRAEAADCTGPSPLETDKGAPCCHPCDLASGCCICIHRAPKPGLLPGLHTWWQSRGMRLPEGPLRFHCATCARSLSDSREKIPLPFGGCLLPARLGTDHLQLVEPPCDFSDQCSDQSWEDVGSDVVWVIVETDPHVGILA